MARELFGREDELAWLDAAWDGEAINVMTIVAWVGVWKTALVSWWRNRMELEGRGVEAVFEWSFYNQGAQERVAVSADNFLREALRFFGDPELADSKASPLDKGARLAELVGAGRSLPILRPARMGSSASLKSYRRDVVASISHISFDCASLVTAAHRTYERGKKSERDRGAWKHRSENAVLAGWATWLA